MPNYGKKFEQQFRNDWINSFPNSFLYRLNDQVSMYHGSSNPCDFIGYVDGKLFLLELKSHGGASIPFSVLTQYDKLVSYLGIPGIRLGVVGWLYDKSICFYVPIQVVKVLKERGEKSVGIRHLAKENIVVIPSKKKRIFLDSDYSILKELKDGE